MATFDADEVFSLMKRRGMTPANQATFTKADFLSSCDEQIRSAVLPKLIKAKTKHGVATQDTAVVAGTQRYLIPDRCVNNAIFSVWLVDSSGAQLPLSEIDAERVPYSGLSTVNRGLPQLFTFEGPYLNLWPVPGSAYTLRVKYQMEPSRLTAIGSLTAGANASPAITSIAGAVVNFPAVSIVAPAAGTKFDLVRGRGTFDTYGLDLVVQSATTSSITFTTSVPTETAVGDYACFSGYAPFPQLPKGLHLAAACLGVGAIVGAKGNTRLRDELYQEAAIISKEVLDSMTPRNASEQADVASVWW